MDSQSLKPTPSTSAKTKTVVVPRIPQEIIDEILDHLATDGSKLLKSCSLVSKSWVPSCRRHLFHTVAFSRKNIPRWLRIFPVPEESPAHHVRCLWFVVRGYEDTPKKFFEHASWFTNVEQVTLKAGGARLDKPLRASFSRLPPSVTSLTVSGDTASLGQIRDIMAQLPNLDDLSLSGRMGVTDDKTLVGIGAALRGRFGGKLELIRGYESEDVMNMLLEVPTGLNFTEVLIDGRNECLFSTVRLAEACSKTLVKLSYNISFHCKYNSLSWASWLERKY